jgi:hypothetical protein
VGNISVDAGNFFIGNGSQLTGVAAASAGFPISSGNSNIAATANANIFISVGGTSNVAVFATTGEYITGVLSASGTITGGNLATGGTASAAGNITGGNVLTGGLISATGTVTGSSLLGSVVSASGNVTGGNVLTGGLISATANVTGGNLLTGGLISATSDITSAANITGGNVLTGGLISATANVTGGNVLTGGLISATSTITSAANITGGNVLTAGLVSATGNVTGNFINGNGYFLTGIITSVANINNGTSNVNIATANANVTVSVNGTANVAVFATTGEYITGELSASGNVIGGNVLTGGLISATSTITSAANITGGNLLTGGLISATSTITSAANVTGGNILTGGLISATGNITSAANVNTPVVNAITGNLLISATVGNINIVPNGNIVLAAGNTYINNVKSPVQSADAVNKEYVDNIATTGITYHQAVNVATTTTLATTTGGTITYAQPNGVANGVGATLTTTTSFNLIDTANVQTVGTRILVKDQANAVQNGIYVWSNATVITRSADADQYGAASTEEISINDYFFVSSGNVNAGSAYVVDAPAGVITFGTSNIAFAQFSSSQTYTANTSAGISLAGTVFSAKVDNDTTAFDLNGNISVKASANLTTPNIGAATGTSLSATGNIQGGNVLTGGLISATSTITSAANITGGNVLTGGLVSATANVTGGNVLTGGLISATSTITSAANITGGNVLTAGLVSATGNVTGNFINGNGYFLTGIITSVANINNGTSNVNIAAANANITVSVDGTSNVAVFATTGEYITGVLSASGNITGGNLLTAGLISATSTITSAANITGGNVLTGGLISATGNIRAGNVTASDFFYANGIAIVNYTASGTPPASPLAGWQWYNTTTDVLYEYLFDGTDDYWVDISSPAFAGGVVANVSIAGSMLLNANSVYDLGSASQQLRDVYATNYYGNGSTLTGIITSVANINNGTSNVSIATANGNITHSVSGNANIGVWYGSGLSITGDLTVSGNATLSGNILGDRIQNGTTSIDIQTAGGNANINIGGTGNLAVFTPGNLVMTGNINPSANITYDLGTTTQRWKDIYLANSTIYLGNSTITANATAVTITNPAGGTTVLAGGSGATSVTGATVSASGNVTGGNVLTGGIISATGNVAGNFFIGNGSALTGIDATGIQSGTSNVKVVSSGGNATISIGGTSNVAVFATTGAFVTGVNSVTGNITGGNILTAGLISATGTVTGSSHLGAVVSVTANVTGGNILTAGLISATGAITGGALTGSSLTVTTGNITGGNLILSGAIIDSAQLDIQTSASNANIVFTPNGTGNVNMTTGLSVTGNITGGNLRTAGLISATGTITSAGNITGGNLTVSTGTITVGNIVNANGNGVGNIGSTSLYFNTIFGKATTAQYADLAENYLGDAVYTPGTVLDFDGEQEVTLSTRDSSKRVAGVVSTNPAHLMNSTLDGAHVTAVALAGRVPTQVTGTIAKGDLMVSAGNGRARAEANPAVGTVIGKALENFSGGEGTIEIVICMQ